jgi:hypothetical protein
MRKAIEAFEQEFAPWDLHLLPDDVANRRSGTLRQLGWLVFYDFGRDGHGEFLDYYAALRDATDDAATDDWHVRIYASGERITLPTVIDAYVYAREPTRDEVERTRRKYEAGLAAAIEVAMAAIGGPDEPPAQPYNATPRRSRPSKPAPRQSEDRSQEADRAPAVPGGQQAKPGPVGRASGEHERGPAPADERPPNASSTAPLSGMGTAPEGDTRLCIEGLETAGEDALVSWMLTPLSVPVVKAEKGPAATAPPALVDARPADVHGASRARGAPSRSEPAIVPARRRSPEATVRRDSGARVPTRRIADADADPVRPWWARRDSRMSIAIVGVAAMLCVAVVSAIVSHRSAHRRASVATPHVQAAVAPAAADSTTADDAAAAAPRDASAGASAHAAPADSTAGEGLPAGAGVAPAAGSGDDAVARPAGPMSVSPIRASNGSGPRERVPVRRGISLPVKPAGATQTPP